MPGADANASLCLAHCSVPQAWTLYDCLILGYKNPKSHSQDHLISNAGQAGTKRGSAVQAALGADKVGFEQGVYLDN